MIKHEGINPDSFIKADEKKDKSLTAFKDCPFKSFGMIGPIELTIEDQVVKVWTVYGLVKGEQRNMAEFYSERYAKIFLKAVREATKLDW